MWGSVRAELVKQARRPASWLLLAAAAVLTITFVYVIPYAGLSDTASGAPNSDRGLASMLPERIVESTIGGLPVFVGALALIFGALVAGSEYGWSTWKTVLTQGPRRSSIYVAKLVTLAIGVAALVLVLFGVAAGASVLVASVEDQAMNWPGLGDLAAGMGAGWLIAMMWGSLGLFLGIAFRSVALPVGLGLVWMLAVQNLLASIAAPLLEWVAELQKGLPGPNAGSLVAALGAAGDTPGVEAIVGSTHATMVVTAYLLGFAALGGWLLCRRDIL